ncbi:MAG: tetratricopeptide repeat protein [Polyangiaceae bacterium]|nr:tetratricopeptide repeat protein [Polyangiaceae bacterium]
MSILLGLLVIGGVWMLADAIRRRADPLWIAALVLLFPFSWPVYFVVVKARDLPWGVWRRAPNHGQGAPEGRPWNPESVSGDGQLALADSLEERERAAEAEPIYRAILARDPESLPAWHGLARALLSLARAREAVEALEQVLVRDRSFRGYSAALDYAEALWQNGQHRDAVEVLESVSTLTRRLNHRVALAHYLTLDGRRTEARTVLQRALAEHRLGVGRGADIRWADRATAMLADLDA